MRKFITAILVLLAFVGCYHTKVDSSKEYESLFNDDWYFIKDVEKSIDEILQLNGQNWQKVKLPHSANIEPLVIKDQQWQGVAYYKKDFFIDKSLEKNHIALNFEGAMQVAEIYLNGELIESHYGGYLPFYVDLTGKVKYGEYNTVLVKLDNQDDNRVPPGKPLDDLDFNIYSGIYRNVWFINRDLLHFSDAVGANRVAGGGLMVSFEDVVEDYATIVVKADVENDYSVKKEFDIIIELYSENNQLIRKSVILDNLLEANSHNSYNSEIELLNPNLWSPDNPYLYTIVAKIVKNEEVVDLIEHKIGIKTFSFTKDGFYLNGEKLWLRGTNRHQEYPYLGYAISDNANYRDVYKIKDAGFNLVRLSHYPQSKSFMNACDELGLMVINAIPGWQYFGDSIFQERALQDVRDMVRRDRNHASVILWEASLNESRMSKEFMEKAHNAVHEELPFDDVYTAGWVNYAYDVYIPARQHSKPPNYWSDFGGDRPLLIAEYGDWEYYAQNAGFNQKLYKDLTADERNSRQLRGFGQKRLAQQAMNYEEAHNSNLKGGAVGDANWLMYDYNRGYAPDIEASGIMDIFRLPKFAYYFYKSQETYLDSNSDFKKPFVYVANYYNDPSFLEVKVYSNCEKVELVQNDISLGVQEANENSQTDYLNQSPFVFQLEKFVPGELVANAYIEDELVASYSRKTPKAVSKIDLWYDRSGVDVQWGVNDVVFIYASLVDENGTTVPDASNKVHFIVEGDGELIGANPIVAEAGIATILLRVGEKGDIAVKAQSNSLKSNVLNFKNKK